MIKKLVSVLLAAVMIIGTACIGVSAAEPEALLISGVSARRVATYYLAVCEPMSFEGVGEVRLGADFTLSDGIELRGAGGDVRFLCFTFTGTLDDALTGYIVISLADDMPYVVECTTGSCPFDAGDTVYYVNPLEYYVSEGGVYLNAFGESFSADAVDASLDVRSRAYAKSGLLGTVRAENAATLDEIDWTLVSEMFSDPEKFKDFILELLRYFMGAVTHEGTPDDINALVEQFIKETAGEGYTMCESYTVDKDYMVPRRQRYYADDVGNGICGKVSSMMMLAYYRDGRGFNLPDDATMFEEFSAIYDDIDDYYAFFFKSDFINNKIGLTYSFEMLGTLDMGLAYYLYTKGYKQEAQNVIDNMRFSVTLVPDAVSDTLLTALRVILSKWLKERTNGELKLTTNCRFGTEQVVTSALAKEEPVIIGCLTAIGDSTFSNHYFAGVGYYKFAREIKLGDITVATRHKEYVEVYDTWAHRSSVMNWSVFKLTALYSVNSLAKLS